LLIANRITDSALNWIWGEGHLVICGDVFDRGKEVTECLWLIYQLEFQAAKSGGKVHYILGNHELMIIRDNNKYYVNDKYIYLSAKLGIDYRQLFLPGYELGRWLRTKNLVVKINDLLFVHGGIPPEFPGMNKTIGKINNSMHYYIDIHPDSIDGLINHFLVEPTWYRGYFDKRDQTEEIQNILDYYQVKHIVVGHTPVRSIAPMHNGMVIAVNVPFGDPVIKGEALVIESGRFFIVDEYGNKTSLSLSGS
jgi:hypothetical protein